MKKGKIALVVLVIMLAMVYLIVSGFNGNTGYEVTISELVADNGGTGDSYTKVEGYLVPGSAQWDGEKIELRFDVTDRKTEMTVVYNGVAPDNFENPEAQILLEGYYDSASGIFKAEKVQTRCPTKYEAA